MNNKLKIIFHLILWTWGLPVTFIGWAMYLLFKCTGCLVSHFYHARVIHVPVEKKGVRGLSIGPFLFIFYYKDSPLSDSVLENILIHEYGHTYQALYLGLLYWFLVGFPSFLWANLSLFKNYRQKNNVSYYSFYCERHANRLGEKVTGKFISNF